MDVKPVRVIAIASGKGGVGKSFLTLNLAEALARMEQRVVVLDADFGLANLELLAGYQPERSIADVLAGDCSLQDVLLEGPSGVRIIPGGRCQPKIAELDSFALSGLIHAVDELAGELDYLLVDTSGGLSPTDLQLLRAAGEILVVVTPEQLARRDAAAYIQTLRRHCDIQHFGVLANMTRRQREGHTLLENLQEQIGFEQDLVLRGWGQIPFETELARPAGDLSNSWRTLIQMNPESRSARSVQMLAESLNRKAMPSPKRGGMAFFLEHSVSAGGM